jgi:hypothetical protein
MGVEAATVQRILRHSSIAVTTGTYMDVIDAVQREAATGMEALSSETVVNGVVRDARRPLRWYRRGLLPGCARRDSNP